MRSFFLFALALFLIGGCSTVGSTPEPAWKSVKKEGNIEIRRYEPMIVAEVVTTGERYDAINAGFRILAAYIFGENTIAQKIAMTAPVTQQAAPKKTSTKIAMTAPVTQEAQAENEWKVGFVMPAEFTMDTLPKPKDSRIKISEVSAHETASMRFSGFNTDRNIQAHEQELKNWLTKNGIKTTGKATYAFYNPPWTPPFMKRNEVMFKIAP